MERPIARVVNQDNCLAVMGMVLTALGGVRYPAVSTVVYVAMGWLIVIAARPVWPRVPAAGLARPGLRDRPRRHLLLPQRCRLLIE